MKRVFPGNVMIYSTRGFGLTRQRFEHAIYNTRSFGFTRQWLVPTIYTTRGFVLIGQGFELTIYSTPVFWFGRTINKYITMIILEFPFFYFVL